MQTSQSPFSISVERMIPGGRGLAFHEGKAVFVPLAAPGDGILVRQFRDRRSYFEVLDWEVVEPSPERVSPPCLYFGTCGGCDFQQMSYPRQLSAKQEILLDALKHTGKISLQAVPIRLHPCSSQHYRNRVQLKLTQASQGASWGFYKSSSHEICAIGDCLIASPVLWRQLAGVRKAIEDTPGLLGEVDEVEAFLGDHEECLVNVSLLDAPANLQTLAERFALAGRFREHSNLHVVLSVGSRLTANVSGSGFVWKTVGGFKYRISHGAFFQVNDLMLLPLREAATGAHSGKQALELFCGVGFFTLSLARQFEGVQAVEMNPRAVSDLRHNLRFHGTGNVQVLERDLRSLLKDRTVLLHEPDLLLVDPPRSGLPKKAIEAIAGLGAAECVYVSCNPSTLARDLQILCNRGYEISSLDLLDLFPQTHHLETVAHLKRG